MNPKEALQKIIDETPPDQVWYKVTSDYDQVNKLRSTALRILQGKDQIQVSTLKWFFGCFGYEVNVNVDVNKKDNAKI